MAVDEDSWLQNLPCTTATASRQKSSVTASGAAQLVSLNYGDIEKMMLYRGICVTYETVAAGVASDADLC